MVRRIDQGYRHRTFVKAITGGGKGLRYGCNLVIFEALPGVTDIEFQSYVDRELPPILEQQAIFEQQVTFEQQGSGCLLALIVLAGALLYCT